MRKYLLLYSLLFQCVCYAQNISVASFKLLDSDLTAITAGTSENDQNGETAALIKVVTTQTGFTFDGGALGIVKTKQTPGEVWVYVPRGSKKITIKHSQLGVLRDYYYPVVIEAARTYEMVLTTGTVQTIVQQARTSQYVVFQLTPANAQVELDGMVLETIDGTATKMMKFGTYDYRVQAPNYLAEAGNVTIDDPKNKKIVNITLKPNYSRVTIKVDNNAEIWVNGEKKGSGTWTGELGKGTYELEARKPGHRSTIVTKDIIVTQEPQVIILQVPTPVYGEADIISKPAMADIYIDGKSYGQTPLVISDLIIGTHQIMISKNGYNNYSASIDINENRSSPIEVELSPINNTDPIADKLKKSGSKNYSVIIQNLLKNMVFIEGGTFKMGASIYDSNEIELNEAPPHQVTLSSYSIGKYEVTQEEWIEIMGRNPSKVKGEKLPVNNVSWLDCQEFIVRLNKITGMEFRLPTEAEWEFAAKGGNKNIGFKYAGGNEVNDIGWYDGNSLLKIHETGKKKPNDLGLFDMSGNVYEWCLDMYNNYSASSQKDPVGESIPNTINSNYAIYRGGCVFDNASNLRTTFRGYGNLTLRSKRIGFRLAL